MPQEPFIRPTLRGLRFDGGVLPLEFLKDLAVLEEMVIEVAKTAYRADHPDRQRSPRGFMDGVSLKLTGIANGSAVPAIALDYPQEGLFAPEVIGYLTRARDVIVNLINDADNSALTALTGIQRKALLYFDRMGRSLRHGESMEFPISGGTGAAVLTQEVRRRLILASDGVKELTEEMSIRGLVFEADQDKQSFELKLYDGRDIKAPISDQHREMIMEAFNGYSSGTRIQLDGIVRINREGRILGVESIESASILDPLDVSARLDEFRLLKNGWLDGHGSAPAPAGLDWLSSRFERCYPGNLCLPHVYPTEDGGVQAEWSLGDHEISLTINLADHTAEWHGMNMASGVENASELNLDDEAAWMEIAKGIQRAGGSLS